MQSSALSSQIRILLPSHNDSSMVQPESAAGFKILQMRKMPIKIRQARMPQNVHADPDYYRVGLKGKKRKHRKASGTSQSFYQIKKITQNGIVARGTSLSKASCASLSSGYDGVRQEMGSCISTRRLRVAKEALEVGNAQFSTSLMAEGPASQHPKVPEVDFGIFQNDYTQISINSNLQSNGTLAAASVTVTKNEDLKKLGISPAKAQGPPGQGPVATISQRELSASAGSTDRKASKRTTQQLSKVNVGICINHGAQASRREEARQRNDTELLIPLTQSSRVEHENEHNIDLREEAQLPSTSREPEPERMEELLMQSISEISYKADARKEGNNESGLRRSQINSISSVKTPTHVDTKRDMSFGNIRAPKFTEDGKIISSQLRSSNYQGVSNQLSPRRLHLMDHLKMKQSALNSRTVSQQVEQRKFRPKKEEPEASMLLIKKALLHEQDKMRNQGIQTSQDNGNAAGFGKPVQSAQINLIDSST